MNALRIIRITLNLLFLPNIHILHVRAIDVKPQKENFTPDYNIYHNLSSIAANLDQLLKENKNLVKRIEPMMYVSKLGRKQHVIHITNFATVEKENVDRLKILLSFGEHAREFLPIESLFHFLKRLFKSWLSEKPDVDLNKLEIYIVTIANPDGRHHIETSKNYCWRGTSSGVDINRNFDWEFGGTGSSNDPSDEEYRGQKPFSEKETRVYRDLTEQIQFDGFLSLHSGIKHIYIPYADSVSQKTGRTPDNIKEMSKLAQQLSNSTIYKHKFGRAVNLNDYAADGTVFDYMAGNRKIPFSYAIELWGPYKHRGPSCFDLFNPTNARLEGVVSNLYPLYLKFINYLLDWKNRSLNTNEILKLANLKEQLSDESLHSKVHTREESGSVSTGIFLMCLLVFATVLVTLMTRYPVCRRMYQRRRIVSLRALSSTLSINLFSV